jgi:hypothetical protein
MIIFLCPFGWLETALKSARGAYFSALLILSAINPVLTLILTLPVLIIARCVTYLYNLNFLCA